ncbi:class-II fumarase/aspartase family protein [Lentzea jiangxiensis]|uniref:3-carboxy-cis,cis-muconate cycloisomerase n=1 Tax=Lentzea jiangxiensis TaxID=641025 RepID=A0A1H0X1P4_9PSEU|nr:adenylosuccinate lyase family protein [Lentzea jiangxiensis]SDP96396.1 3-carboxy-cis,cis-muconate cycloisomerase [Lentzea jiangxiensis]
MPDSASRDSASPDSGLLAPVRAGVVAASLTDDAAWLRAMLDAEAALVRAQATLGVAPRHAADVITEVAGTAEFDLVALARAARGAANPVVAVVGALGAAVAEADPAAAQYVHRGSTSQDILDTAAMLVVARTSTEILEDLRRVETAALRLAAAHRDTLMAGRTLGAHAVPVTFGLKAAGWATAVHDAAKRLSRLTLPIQLGGAAGTLAGYLESAKAESGGEVAGDYARLLGEEFAKQTGLSAPLLPWHTNRIPIAETGFAAALVTGVLGKIAVDVQVLSRTEISEVAEPFAEGRGVSSAMPHKRNPALATLIRAAATQTPGLIATLASCLPAEDERPAGAWHAEWHPLRELLRLTAGAAETAVELVEGLTVDAERMRDNLDLTHGLIVSERLSATLVPRLGRTEAVTAIRAASLTAHHTRTPLHDVLAADPAVTAHLTATELADLTRPSGYLGAAGSLVDDTLAALAWPRTDTE